MPITISSAIPSGNIEVIAFDDPNDIHVAIRGDIKKPTDFQWFNFQLTGEVGQTYVVHIDNAGKAKFPGWNTYGVAFQTSASYDGESWFTVPTVFDEASGTLTMTFELMEAQIQLAFFPPYSLEKHAALIDMARAESGWSVTSLGKTNGEDGRDITLVTIGEPAPQKKKIWVIAGQHPGEHQAPWYMDGLLRHLQAALSDYTDLLEHAVLYCVPNMNPDGTFYGNLRTNGEGKDLNRMWQTASIEESPEVYYVLEAMQRIGVDFFVDVHSDEEIPRAFLVLGHNGCMIEDETKQALEGRFLQYYIENGDMQDELKYDEKPRQLSNLDLASAYVAERFGCPAFTLEMPSKEWTWQQSQRLGVAFLRVMQLMLPLLLEEDMALRVALSALRDDSRTKSPAQLSLFTTRRPVKKMDSTIYEEALNDDSKKDAVDDDAAEFQQDDKVEDKDGLDSAGVVVTNSEHHEDDHSQIRSCCFMS